MSKKDESKDSRKIDTGGGAYIEGRVETEGGDFVGRDQYKKTGLDAAEVAQLFEKIYAAIDSKPDLSATEKSDLKAEVKEVKAEAGKGDQADESYLLRRLRAIQRMAPDILDVVVTTLANPAAGFGMVAKKVAEKMKADAG